MVSKVFFDVVVDNIDLGRYCRVDKIVSTVVFILIVLVLNDIVVFIFVLCEYWHWYRSIRIDDILFLFSNVLGCA